ncbi:MAG: hypothetical protein ACYTG1_07095 [Planctomycetota bacterium]|jgi:hypothetical protein
MTTTSARTTTRRRLAGAVVILLAAGAIAIVTTRQQAADAAEIERRVLAVCRAAEAGDDAGPLLGATTAHVAESLAARLEAAGGGTWTAEATRGDHPEYGDGAATHTVRVRLDGHEVIGLRVLHRAEDPALLVLGYWTPVPP